MKSIVGGWDGEVIMHKLLALSCIYFQCDSVYFHT